MIYLRDEEAIIAQCTPSGNGAIALIRLSGLNAIEIATQCAQLADGSFLITHNSHTIHYGAVIDEHKTIIDHVLFLLMKAPKTFTGQDTVEITCHNNPFIIERIIQTAIAYGARPASHGEFTKRAFLNGKIDLLQAEAINELIQANNQLSLKQSLAQLEGTFSQWLLSLEKNIIHCLALSEASFEFIDEEMEFGKQIGERIGTIIHSIQILKKTFDQQQRIRQGFRIAIIGTVNAGKSQLFNAILNQNRSIVTNIAGTTRDSIEAGIYRQQSYWTLIDTAGLRKTDDIIEQEGISRSFAEAEKADLILLVFDGSRNMDAQEKIIYQELIHKYPDRVLLIRNKIDQQQSDSIKFNISSINVSGRDKTNIDLLEQAIEQKLEYLVQSSESPFLLNRRQFNLLIQLEKNLIQVLQFLSPAHYELISFHLKDALECLTELTGKTISEQGMDAVFKEFCVGK